MSFKINFADRFSRERFESDLQDTVINDDISLGSFGEDRLTLKENQKMAAFMIILPCVMDEISFKPGTRLAATLSMAF